MNNSPWVTSKEASRQLGVTEKTLHHWREIGYLKPGTHWRSSAKPQLTPWKPEVIYHLNWCQEGIDYWRSQDAPMNEIAA